MTAVHARALFLIGNKRSGTSLLIRLLNLHQGIFVSHEADIVWLLYCLSHGRPPVRYPWDGEVGLHRTLSTCRETLRDYLAGAPLVDVARVFTDVESHLMDLDAPAKSVDRLRWIGDKKPVQQCDPDVLPFLQQHFPDARYVHVIRHPAAVVASMSRAAATWSKGVPPYWRRSAADILDRWATHEEWVLQAKQKVAVCSVRLEDLTADPCAIVGQIVAFLELEMPHTFACEVAGTVEMNVNAKYRAPCNRLEIPVRARGILDQYY